MRLKIAILFLFTVSLCAGQTAYTSAGRMLTLEELMDTTISISTGTEKTVAQAPSIATVITKEQIARSSATDIFEALDSIPGLFVYPGPSFYGKIDIRGIHTAYGPQVIIMINGTPIKRLQNGNMSERFNFPASLIERVEIIRGPGSAVYGADAFSGVINIITKDAKDLKDGNEVGVLFGSFDKKEVFARTKTSFNEAKIAMNISYMTEGNDKDRLFATDQQSIFDGIFGVNASKAPGAVENRGKWLNLAINGVYKEFEMNFWAHLGRDNGAGTGIGMALDPQGYVDNDQFQLDVYHRSKPSNGLQWEQKLSLAYIYMKSYLHIFPQGTVLPIGSDGNAFTSGGGIVSFPEGYIGSPRSKDYSAAIENALLVSKYENHLIRISVGGKYTKVNFYEFKNFGPGVIDGSISTVGGALTDVSGTPYVYIPNTDQKILFASLQDEISLAPAWTLTAGVRDDYYSDFGNTINPRLALVWSKDPSLSVKLLYARAFRAPSFQELYARNNPVALGNSDLKPEVMDMRELGVEYRPDPQWHLGVNVYDYVADKLIGTVPVAVGIQAANIGKQLGDGVETVLHYQPREGVLLSADYAYRRTKNSTTGKSVANAPMHIGHLRADIEFYTNAILSWETQFAANTPRAEGDTRAKIKDYAISHLSITHEPIKNTRVKVSVRNIFNKEYYYPTTTPNISDFTAPGRSLYAQLTYRF
ncbi:MAG TPA: TonB-dependent receptor [Campylobacterales bacterium]|nr:TonB-dependent receptor [Campylobacterales bacterium]